MNKYNVNVAYENNFEIEANSKDEAESIACKLFWEEQKNAELLNLETEGEADEQTCATKYPA